MNDNLDFGIGRRVINPPFPMGMAGYFNTRMWQNILDDLEVRCVVFRQNDHIALIMQFDLITITPTLYHRINAALADTPLAGAWKMISATHTHTAPELREGRGGYNPEFVPFAAAMAREAALAAWHDCRPAGGVSQALAHDIRFAFNRRYWMKDGSVVTNPGKNNPDILRPEGEIDPEIPVITIHDADGQKRLVLCSISNHADTTGGNNISGDWPGHARRQVEATLPPGGMCIPLIGCSGNINHFNPADPSEQSSPEESRRIGCGYAASVIAAISDAVPEECGRLSTVCRAVECPSRELFPEELAEAQAVMNKYRDLPDMPEDGKSITANDLAAGSPAVLKLFAADLLKNAADPQKRTFELPLLRLGNCVICGVPSEPFVETNLRLRKAVFSDAATVLVAIQCNGSGSGYIPNIWNYRRGGYECTPRSNIVSIHTAEKIIAEIGDMKNEL